MNLLVITDVCTARGERFRHRGEFKVMKQVLNVTQEVTYLIDGVDASSYNLLPADDGTTA